MPIPLDGSSLTLEEVLSIGGDAEVYVMQRADASARRLIQRQAIGLFVTLVSFEQRRFWLS